LRCLGYGNPVVSKAVLPTAIPAMPMVIMIAVQYRALEAEVASAVFLSVIGSVITMGVFIALTSQKAELFHDSRLDWSGTCQTTLKHRQQPRSRASARPARCQDWR
jgi:hypothetical protein